MASWSASHSSASPVGCAFHVCVELSPTSMPPSALTWITTPTWSPCFCSRPPGRTLPNKWARVNFQHTHQITSPLLRPCNEMMAQQAAVGPAPLHPLSLHYPMGTALPPWVLLANVQFPCHLWSLHKCHFLNKASLAPLFDIKPSPPTPSLNETCPRAEGQPGPRLPPGGLGRSSAGSTHPAPRACVLAASFSGPQAL